MRDQRALDPAEIRFEGRLAAALRGYAGEIPTEVDAAEIARSVADLGRQRTLLPWLRSGLGGAGGALRLGLAIAILLGLLVGLLSVGRYQATSEPRSMLSGTMRCTTAGAVAPAGPPTPLTGTLSCTLDATDPRVAGSLRLSIDAIGTYGGAALLRGDARLETDDRTWSGSFLGDWLPNGVIAADLTVETDGGARRSGAMIHAISTDGLRWSVIGTVGPS